MQLLFLEVAPVLAVSKNRFLEAAMKIETFIEVVGTTTISTNVFLETARFRDHYRGCYKLTHL